MPLILRAMSRAWSRRREAGPQKIQPNPFLRNRYERHFPENAPRKTDPFEPRVKRT